MTPAQVAGLIEAAGVQLSIELANLGEPAAAWHPGPGEWCAKECLGHLMQSERYGFHGRLLLILAAPAGTEPDLPPSPPQAAGYCDRSLDDLLREFVSGRQESARFVKGLAAADLERAGNHARVGRLTVNEILHEWVHHDRDHIRQVMAVVQAYVWPDMGAAQKFTS